MATYTENYNLVKPTMAESADIRTINGNMDSVDNIMHATQVSLANAYDSSETYNTGDIVMYEFLMYECLEDEVTGAWDATKWQRTTAGEHGGGGSDVSITPTLQSGTKIADYEIDGVSGALYAPSGGGGSGVEKISWIDYNQLTPAEKSNGNAYFIPDAGANPVATASGSIASFSDGTDNPLNDLKIEINAVQSGSGDPSPSNPRPISGWTGASVSVSGKNMTEALSDKNVPDLHFSSSGGGTSPMQYSESEDAFYTSSHRALRAFDKVGTYTVSFEAKRTGTESTYAILGYGNVFPPLRTDYSDSWVRYSRTINVTEQMVSTGYFVFYNSIYIRNLQIELGSTATTYEPYAGTTYPISWQTEAGTVYGGKLDVVSGELVVNRGYVDLGSLNWTARANSRFDTTLSDANNGININAICSAYNRQVISGWGSLTNGGFSIRNLTLRIADERYTDATTFKTAMNGVQLVYELATPITYHLSPTAIKSLLGYNNIWADCGDVEVKYYKNIQISAPQIRMDDVVYAQGQQGGGDSGHTYSTEEKVVGTWVDGTTIYERTIPVNLTIRTTTQVITSSVDISNMRLIVSMMGNYTNTNDEGCFPITGYKYNGNLYAKAMEEALINYITIQYTKITD